MGPTRAIDAESISILANNPCRGWRRRCCTHDYLIAIEDGVTHL